jgi:hypothetical protein
MSEETHMLLGKRHRFMESRNCVDLSLSRPLIVVPALVLGRPFHRYGWELTVHSSQERARGKLCSG